MQICDSDKPYEPLAMRQHFAGPYPLDPNLLAQGIPPDDRITFSDHEFGPVQGTPLPPGRPGSAPPLGAPMAPQSGDIPSIAPLDLPSPPSDPQPPSGGEGTAPAAAPSSLRGSASRVKPSVAVAEYDPGSGRYLDAHGKAYTQSNLATTSGRKTWKELILSEH